MSGKIDPVNGWLDLLFGIGAQSSYEFLIPIPTWHRRARSKLDGKTSEFVRHQAPAKQPLLRWPGSNRLRMALCWSAFGGLDRDSYQTIVPPSMTSALETGRSKASLQAVAIWASFCFRPAPDWANSRSGWSRSATRNRGEFLQGRAQIRRSWEKLKAELADLSRQNATRRHPGQQNAQF